MKIKKIINLCKNAHSLSLFADDERNMQWISDGVGFYPLQCCPVFDEDSFCYTYDITDTQRDKIIFRINEPLPKQYDFSDFDEFETEIIKMPLSVSYSSYSVIAFKTEHGIEFINSAHLLPFADYDSKELRFTLRINKAGQAYFAVKNGFMLIGIIQTINMIDRSFIKELNAFQKLIEATYYNQLEGSKENRQIEMTGSEDNV